METKFEGLTEGRIVHYVAVTESGQVQHRPAIIVRVWRDPEGVPGGAVNMQVFTDSNGKDNDGLPPVMWKTSVMYDESGKPGTWHWIEKA